MLYEITDGTVASGGETVLSHIHFEIKGKEKIGVTGPNGAGKTTLLRLIAGELTVDRDDRRQGPAVRTARAVSIGLLSQTQERDTGKTVDEILMEACPAEDMFSKDRYEYQAEYDRIFTGFGFQKEDKKKKLGDFSGGEKTRISMIRLLLMKPEILLLDEPTNHLDFHALEWLEDYMRQYPGAVVCVSHDRFFLDRVVDVIYDLRNGRLYRYTGSYTSFRKQRSKELAAAVKAYENQQKEIARLDELIRKFRNKPRKAAFARSRKTMLDRMEKLARPEEDDIPVFPEEILPLIQGNKWPLEVKDLQIGYADTLLTLSLRVRRGQRIGIIGDNGAGKTTFLRTIAGFLAPRGGECRLGEHTTIGYFDQMSAAIDSDLPVVEHFHRLFPVLNEKEARGILGRYLFKGRKAQIPVKNLSGGEKARLVLCELLESRLNLLILDEPTNHMDIRAKEALEAALRAYKGTILFVSHDRYLIRQLADAILVFEGDHAMYYPFGYDHYLERVKKAEGDNPAALIRAEDQAMLEGIRNVPQKERHRLREYSTEELSRDWQERLASEEVFAAEKQYGELLEEASEQALEEYRLWYEESLGEGCPEEERERKRKRQREIKEKVLDAEKRLTERLAEQDAVRLLRNS